MNFHILFCVVFAFVLNVCNGTKFEAVDDDMGTKMKNDPVYKNIIEESMEKPWRAYRDELESKKKRNRNWRDSYSSELIEVPVVIHVIYKPDEFIIGNEQIQSNFRTLNDAFFNINYWNKPVLEEYHNLSANFSMQFKLSNIKYIDATGKGPESESGWTQDEAVIISPNFDQHHYLHMYLVSEIEGGNGSTILGYSSFPMPLMTMDECYPEYGFLDGIPTPEECVRNDLFARYILPMFHVGNNQTKCMQWVQSRPDIPPRSKTNCVDYLNMVILTEMTNKYGIDIEQSIGDICVQFFTAVCEDIVNDKTQVIIFATDIFGDTRDDSRKQFSNGDYRWAGYLMAPGRTVPHEVGHWVGLRHIFSDAVAEEEKCVHGDEVADTLPQEHKWTYPWPDCPASPEDARSCNSTDMYNNYMDYSKCADLNYMFTQGQVDRGRYFFEDSAQLRHSFMDYRSNIVTKFINSIYFIIDREFLDVDKNPCHSGDLWIEQNVNTGTNSEWIIYICATYTMNPFVDMITELKFTSESFRYPYLDCGDGFEKIDINLNYGNNGDEIYLCYKKEKYCSYSAKPITNINILVTNMKYRQKKLRSEDNWNVLTQNLNENSGSEQFVYLVYNTKRKSKNDVFSAGVKPIILEKNVGWDNVEKHNINHIDNEDKVVISQRKYLRSKHHEEHLFSYDKLIYFFGLSSGISICAICLILIGVIYYMKNHTFEIYDKVKQNEYDNEQV